MGKKIFVSYKFADDKVENLSIYENSTVRDYVTKFEKMLDPSDNIYKGESDGEDLSNLSEATIWEKLKGRIYDSSVTIVFISPCMKESWKMERDQWIPWEISYSLKEVSRKNKNGDAITSRSNAILAVVLPDENGSYSYYLESRNCCDGGCTIHHTDRLFSIIRKNKFNLKKASKKVCDTGDTIWYGEFSYIKAVKWSNFINNYSAYVDSACRRQDNIDDYAIMRKINEKDYNNQAEYEYAQRKHEFFIEDLKRYNIRALLIDEYKEITDILNEIEKRLNHNNVFISGSAQKYGDYTEREALEFIESLSKELILQDFNIISGFGLGVGSAVIVGALQEIYMKRKSINENRLLLRPFPQGIEDDNTRKILWKKYREDMISRSGVSIFLFGNKLVDGKIVLANGMESEYKIALERHCLIVPVGCTGYMAEEIWKKVNSSMSDFYTNIDDVLIQAFKKLNYKSSKLEVINNIISFIKLFENGKHSPK